MKSFLKVIICGFFLVATTGVNAQKGVEDGSKYGHGEDSARCVRNTSFYREFVKQNNFKDAVVGWRMVLAECPKSSKNVYIDGVRIMKFFIDKEKDLVVKEKYIDTLMMVYDMRIQHFGEKGYVLGRKSVDSYFYRNSKPEDIQQAYADAEESINLLQEKSSEATVQTYMIATVALFKAGQLDNAKVIDNYTRTMSLLDQMITAENSKLATDVKAGIDQLFGTSGAADCKSLIPVYEPKFNEKPNDLDNLKNILRILSMAKCEDSKLFVSASENLYLLEPSAESAYNMARIFANREEYNKSIDYYNKAIDQQTNNDLKAKWYYEMATIYFKIGSKQSSRAAALNAIKLKDNWGDPYILIGLLYAGSANDCGSNQLERKAAYWAAVDKMQTAKRVDPSCAEKANKFIGDFAPYYPNKEDAFFYGVKEGDAYTVGCWIGETTTARF